MPRFQHLLILIILAIGTSAFGQNSFQVGFWNVENLFDTTKSTTAQDGDFTPQGKYAWTEDRLVKKYQDLARVIHDMDGKNDLAILGLAEIENFSVLDRFNSEFIQGGFEIIHKESPDERGIDCALLYKPQLFTLLEKHFIPVFLAGDNKTRDIIEAQFTTVGDHGKHTFFVFINHWPSRWGGQAQTDPLRRAAAATLRIRINEILLSDPQADIMIMGDFNDHPDDPSVQEVLRAASRSSNPYPGDLINTTWELQQDPNTGTLMYRGKWGVLDQIIISYGMVDGSGYSWTPSSTHPFHASYLLEKTGDYAGWPFRMYRHGKYQGGYSDHLPIVCRVSR